VGKRGAEKMGAMVAGGLGYTNCQYGYGVGNAGGMWAAGYGGVYVVTTEKPALMVAPGAGCLGEMTGMALEVFTETEPTKLEKLAALAAMGAF
jgi:hypothetical protein